MTLGEVLVAAPEQGGLRPRAAIPAAFQGQGITVLSFVEQAAEAFARIRIEGLSSRRTRFKTRNCWDRGLRSLPDK